MTAIIIEGLLFDVPDHIQAGAPFTPETIQVLQELYYTRVRYRATAFINKNPTLSHTAVQAEITRIALNFVFDDSPEPDLVDAEALEIACETIRAKLAAANLPPPRNLADHAAQLISDPTILAEARKRVLARTSAAREILGL